MAAPNKVYFACNILTMKLQLLPSLLSLPSPSCCCLFCFCFGLCFPCPTLHSLPLINCTFAAEIPFSTQLKDAHYSVPLDPVHPLTPLPLCSFQPAVQFFLGQTNSALWQPRAIAFAKEKQLQTPVQFFLCLPPLERGTWGGCGEGEEGRGVAKDNSQQPTRKTNKRR